MTSNAPLSILSCCTLALASVFQTASADVIITPIPTVDDRKLLDAYEAAGGALNFSDLVCLSGVVMLAVTFFEKTGRVPAATDKTDSGALLMELGLRHAGGAVIFANETLAHWLNQFSRHYPRRKNLFQQQVVDDTGFATADAQAITHKLAELDWAAERYRMATSELVGVKQLYAAATSFFKAAAAEAPDHVFTVSFFQQLAFGLEDALEMNEFVRGGINRWKQFSIRKRILDWQRLYEQSPQGLYDVLIRQRMCEFETKIWLRELDKLQARLQEPTHESLEVNFHVEPQQVQPQLDPFGQPDLIS